MINEALMGVVIGGIIGLAGNALDILHSNKQKEREKEERLEEKKEETYLKAIEIATRYYAEYPILQPGRSYDENDENKINELNNLFNSIRPAMSIYSTKKSYAYFTYMIKAVTKLRTEHIIENDELNNNFEIFVEEILRDLGREYL